jgi:hypothetical protein
MRTGVAVKEDADVAARLAVSMVAAMVEAGERDGYATAPRGALMRVSLRSPSRQSSMQIYTCQYSITGVSALGMNTSAIFRVCSLRAWIHLTQGIHKNGTSLRGETAFPTAWVRALSSQVCVQKGHSTRVVFLQPFSQNCIKR